MILVILSARVHSSYASVPTKMAGNVPMLWKRTPIEQAQPYGVLAKVYDYLMRHVDYVEWADYVERVFRSFGPVPQRLVEVACGTGTLAIELARRGYFVHGLDCSEAMIAEARAKADGLSNGAPTFDLGDMRDLPADEADAVLCLYDSVNYCLSDDDLGAAIAGFRRVAREGALCVFDVTTEANSLRYFQDYQYRERHDGYAYNRHSRYSRADRLQINEFVIQQKDAPHVIREVHTQRVFPLSDVLAAVSPDDWSVIGTFGDYTLELADEQAERIHIVLRAR